MIIPNQLQSYFHDSTLTLHAYDAENRQLFVHIEEEIGPAQAEYDQGKPDVVVGSSRGGAVAMNIDSKETPLVLLCPGWRTWGTATIVKMNTTIHHSRADDVVPLAHSEELIENSGLPSEALIVTGTEHRLADDESLGKMLEACEKADNE